MSVARTAPAALLAALALAACAGDGGGDSKPAVAAAEPVRCEPASRAPRRARPRARWRKGERREVTVERSRLDAGGAGRSSSSQTGEIEVLEVNAGGYVLRYRPNGLAFAPAGDLDPDMPEGVRDALEGLEIEYSTDRAGAFARVENVDEVRDRLERMLDVAAEAADSESAQALVAVREVILSREFIETRVVEDLILLHDPYGLDLREGEEVKAEAQFPNPLSEAPLPADAEVRLADARDRDGCVVIEGALVPDARALAESVADFQARAGGEPPELDGLEVRHEARSRYDPGSTWVVRVDSKTTTDVPGERRVDRVVLTLR